MLGLLYVCLENYCLDWEVPEKFGQTHAGWYLGSSWGLAMSIFLCFASAASEHMKFETDHITNNRSLYQGAFLAMGFNLFYWMWGRFAVSHMLEVQN